MREGIDIDEALAYVQARKPTADPLPHQREDLRRWWAARTERHVRYSAARRRRSPVQRRSVRSLGLGSASATWTAAR